MTAPAYGTGDRHDCPGCGKSLPAAPECPACKTPHPRWHAIRHFQQQRREQRAKRLGTNEPKQKSRG